MQNETPSVPAGGSTDQSGYQSGTVFGALDGDALNQPVSLSSQPQTYEEAAVRPRISSVQVRLIFFGLLAVFLLGGTVFAIIQRVGRPAQTKAGQFGITKVPLASIASTNPANNAASLRVNGQLQVTNSLVLLPTSRPTNATAGQLYYDQSSKQLTFYNGEQFISLVGSGNASSNTTNVTNVTNVTSGGSTAPIVQLQSTAPGVQQTGNFNISGVGQVGTLKTTVISSGGETLFVNPVGSTSQPGLPVGTPATVGLNVAGALSEGPGWQNELSATKITMGNVGGTAKSIAVYFKNVSPGDQVQVGLYADDGDIPSKPDNLLAGSAVTTLSEGFTTVTIPAVNLSANTTYWLTENTTSTTASRTYNGGNQASCFVSKNFGFMPDPFSAPGCFSDNNLYAIYLNYTVGAGPSGSLGQAALTVGPEGQTTFQNATDSTTAFQVQNAAGTSTILNVDTVNGRIGVGKTTPSYKLDIAGGDVNLSNGRSIRFGGSPTLSVNSAADTTSISNFASGGKVVAQAATFVVQDAGGAHQNFTIDSGGAAVFSNRNNTTAGFQVQNATGTPLFTADTSNMTLTVGNAGGSATPVILYLANKNTADDPVGSEGGIYYNSTLSSFRCFYSGFWHNCADIEPQHSFSLYDEFMGGSTSFGGPIGSLSWDALAIVANGSLSFNPSTPAPSADRPGVLRVQTPAAGNEGTTFMLGDASGGSMIIAKDNDMKTAVAVGAATGQVLRVGLDDEAASTTQPVSGVWWEANPAANANWRFCYGDGATATCTPTSVAIAANAWVTLEARITATGNGTSSAFFIINNTSFSVSGVTIDSTNRVSPALNCYATTASAQSCYWDYFHLTGTTSAIR